MIPLAVLVATLALAATAGASAVTFTNSGFITVPATGTFGIAAPYPSTILVSGLSGTITNATVTLEGVRHTFAADLVVLLVGPTGENVLLLSNAGGSGDFLNTTLTFDDDAAGPLVVAGSGTYQPTNASDPGSLPAPAPTRPYGSTLSVLSGTNPNGAWALYVLDDAGADVGSIAGWSLTLELSRTPAELIDDAVALVDSLGLPRGTATSLKSKLADASVALAEGRTDDACGALGAFLHEVEAQTPIRIPHADATRLVDAIDEIRSALGCA